MDKCFSRINIPDITENSGIPFEYLMVENEDFKKLIECPICFKILNEPLTCKKCAKSFCKNCINLSLQSTKNCPCCGAIFNSNKIMGQATRNQLNICKFKCFYKNKGCQEIISYSNFFEHINKCNKGDYICNNIKYSWKINEDKKFSPNKFEGEKCKFKGNKNDLEKHSIECGLEKIYCSCCEKIFYSIDIRNHCEICYKKKGKCPYCGKEIILFDYENHYKNFCEEVEINCNKCEMKFLRKNSKKHNKLECLENQVKNLKNENIILKEEIKIIKEDIKPIKTLLQNKRERENK